MNDLISKQAAIDAINTWDKFGVDERNRVVKWHEGLEPYIHLRDVVTAITNLPSAQSEKRTKKRTKTHGVCLDAISRQAAIDIERNATVDTNPTHFEAHQKFIQFMDDAEISSFGRWQWANGFNMALTAVGIDLKKLPSIQPDAVPVVHGRWIAHTMSEITGYDPALSGDDPVCSYSCSVCGEDCYVSDTGDDILSNYCPHCGADMRGEQDG